MGILPKEKDGGFKSGPNKMDQLKIKELSSEGVKAEEISQRLKIQLKSVKSWMPKKKKKKATKED